MKRRELTEERRLLIGKEFAKEFIRQAAESKKRYLRDRVVVINQGTKG